MSKQSSEQKQELKVGSPEWRKEVAAPLYNTDEWQKFVLSLLKPDELIEGHPSAAGLMRVLRLLADVYSIHTSVYKSPTSTDRSATVSCTLSLKDCFLINTVCSTADVSEYNTKAPFNKHPVATAETKALGRAAKLLLNIKIHTHEEMLEDENDYKKINERQIKTINLLCERLDVDKEKFLAANAGVSPATFEVGQTTLSEEDGVRLLEILNFYQTKGVPEEFTTLTQDTLS